MAALLQLLDFGGVKADSGFERVEPPADHLFQLGELGSSRSGVLASGGDAVQCLFVEDAHVTTNLRESGVHFGLQAVQAPIDSVEAAVNPMEALVNPVKAVIDPVKTLIDSVEAAINSIKTLIDLDKPLFRHAALNLQGRRYIVRRDVGRAIAIPYGISGESGCSIGVDAESSRVGAREIADTATAVRHS